MDVIVQYPNGYAIPSTVTAPTTLTGTETDLFVVKDLGSLKATKATAYIQLTLGVVTSGTFQVYFSPNVGAVTPTWYPISKFDSSTGAATVSPILVNSSTYAVSGVSQVEYTFNVEASTAFKITGVASSGTPTLGISVMVRNT